MLAPAVLGLSLVIGLLLIGYWLANADPRSVLRALRYVLIGVGATVVLLLVATGRFAQLLPLAFLLLPMLMRRRVMANRAKAAAGPTPGQQSEARTAFLHARLDHDTGAMEVEFTDGPLAGHRCADLDQTTLIAAFQACQEQDPQSAAIIAAYLDRYHGSEWRDAAAEDGPAGDNPAGNGADGAQSRGGTGSGDGRRRTGAVNGRMTEDEALAILGLARGATKQDIKDAHRRLMLKLHPDQGGSDYLAAKLNEAKDMLLGLAGAR